MNAPVYNIPLAMVRFYRGSQMVVRAHDPRELVETLKPEDLEQLAYAQILSPDCELDSLKRWQVPVPVDVVLQHPQQELPLLYEYAPLQKRRAVRISIPVAPGFGRAVRLAASLRLAVKLDWFQPDQALLEEGLQVVDYYLHHSTVSQPIEFFHSLFLAFCRQDQVTLWAIQEEDPASFRYITDQGQEVLSRRLPHIELGPDAGAFVRQFKEKLLAAGSECCGCDFLECCAGYFKLPRSEFNCDGVRRLLQTLRQAANEMNHDLAVLSRSKGELP